MRLILSVGGRWKSVDVHLLNGSVPCIGGATLPSDDQQLEPALWFKVLVLERVCVDCNEYVISWNVNAESSGAEDAIGKRISCIFGDGDAAATSLHDESECAGSLETNQSESSEPSDVSPDSMNTLESLSCLLSTQLGSMEGSHSLMAAHDSGGSSLCTDDLQALFELAETLFGEEGSSNNSSQFDSSSATELKTWLQLLHCYLLPLITFHHEDLPAVSQAHHKHMELLSAIDEHMEDLSSKRLKLKNDLAALLSKLLSCVGDWAQRGLCSTTFISRMTSDLKLREQEARAKLQSCTRNMKYSQYQNMSHDLGQRLQKEQAEAENVLLEMLQLRSMLEGTLSFSDEKNQDEVEVWEVQSRYIQLHSELCQLRSKSAALSSEKVLALSVREAIEQTMSCLVSGHATSGLDVGIHGGHSTDVLQEASAFTTQSSNNYLTWRDRIQKLLQVQSTPLTQLHTEFCHHLHSSVFSSSDQGERSRVEDNKSVSDAKSLALLVKGHFEKVVDNLCTHFSDHRADFVQRVWLCYERLFFESFSENIFCWYQAEQAKTCRQLMANAVGISVVDPKHLDLGIVDDSWLILFPPRSFSSAVEVYQQVIEMFSLLPLPAHIPKTDLEGYPYLEYFSGVISDLWSLPLAISPLDRLQLLTSAFRKAMTGLSRLKMKPYQEFQDGKSPDGFNASLAAVNCDEILPVLVLLMLQLPPWFLAILHLNCCLLTDFMAPFLSPGWHGYSLAAFSSTLHIISKL